MTLGSPILDHLVRRCLAKNADDRWQSAADVMRELKWFAEVVAHAPAAGAGSSPRRLGSARRTARYAWTLATVSMVLAAGLAA